ncbi:MAG: FHA domain-containing protein [Vulcanimicrobiota bacterium]
MRSPSSSRFYVILIILAGVLFLWSTVNVYAEKEDKSPGIMIAQSKEEKKTETKKPETKKPDDKKPTASPTGKPTKVAEPSKPAGSPKATEEATVEPTPQESAPAGETPSGEPSTPTEAAPSPTQAPSGIAGILAKFDVKKNIIPIAGGIAGLIVILIVIMILTGKKKKHVCERCGKSVLPGMVFCDECSGSGPSFAKQDSGRMETKTVPPRDDARTPSYTTPPPAAVPTEKKKARPSGRVIAVITIRRGANQGHRFNFYESIAQITIGSDPDCDIVVEEDEEVSARHAVISMGEGSSFYVHDMGNTSGLFVNSDRVKQSGLKSGDVIKMGKTELTFARL